jgi:hypothetical protein
VAEIQTDLKSPTASLRLQAYPEIADRRESDRKARLAGHNYELNSNVVSPVCQIALNAETICLAVWRALNPVEK